MGKAVLGLWIALDGFTTGPNVEFDKPLGVVVDNIALV